MNALAGLPIALAIVFAGAMIATSIDRLANVLATQGPSQERTDAS